MEGGFDGKPETSQPAAHAVVRASVFVAIVLLALLATFLRQEGVPKARTLWAEDGAVFAACAYERGPLPCVAEAYGGYFQVAPRLSAIVVPMGDPADLPFRITLVSALVAAAAALLAGRAVAETRGEPRQPALGPVHGREHRARVQLGRSAPRACRHRSRGAHGARGS